MKRLSMSLIAALGVMLMLIGPSATFAHGARHPHHAAIKRRHRRARSRLERFGSTTTTTTTTSTTPATTTTTSTTSTQTTETSTSTTTSSAPAPAGTVASFANGVLTLTLADHSTVSGTVNADTEIECRSASGDEGQGDGPGDDNSSDPSSGGATHDVARVADHGDAGGDGGPGQPSPAATCTSADLVSGADVGEAELRVGPAGAIWTQIDLIR